MSELQAVYLLSVGAVGNERAIAGVFVDAWDAISEARTTQGPIQAPRSISAEEHAAGVIFSAYTELGVYLEVRHMPVRTAVASSSLS